MHHPLPVVWRLPLLLVLWTTTPILVNAFSTKSKSPPSIGALLQEAQSAHDLLDVAVQFWLPTDPDLPSHYRTQQVHHEKRQRWASQWLTKFSLMVHDNDHDNHDQVNYFQDDRLARALLSAALPLENANDRPDKEGRYICDSLMALHAIVAKSSPSTSTTKVLFHEGSRLAIQTLMQRACQISPQLPLPQVCQVRWAIRGLQARLDDGCCWNDNDMEDDYQEWCDPDSLALLDDRVQNLPFDVIPCVVDWKELVLGSHTNMNMDTNNHHDEQQDHPDLVVPVLRNAIPFQKDVIVTRSGSSVTERRGTAWVADEGIGALAYSGKLMTPKPIPDLVGQVMRRAEQTLGLSSSPTQPFFDCALCNHYPDGDAACKFHTDPEHGTLWDRLTVVVAAGDDRKFAFKPIGERTQWEEWDCGNDNNNNHLDTIACEPVAAVTHLFSGDLVVMRDNCNDDFYHAVHAREADKNDATAGGERISLVLKRALDRGGGKRGHGLAGEGRRARRVTRHTVSSDSSLGSAATTASRVSGGGDSREFSQSSKSNNNNSSKKRGSKSKINNPSRSSK
jgi:alkylated DNA repair dioxygenase AlkB